jgi:hypothetical protein
MIERLLLFMLARFVVFMLDIMGNVIALEELFLVLAAIKIFPDIRLFVSIKFYILLWRPGSNFFHRTVLITGRKTMP